MAQKWFIWLPSATKYFYAFCTNRSIFKYIAVYASGEKVSLGDEKRNNLRPLM